MVKLNKQGWTLYKENTVVPVLLKDNVVSFRGDKSVVLGGTPPHKPSSEGKVWVSETGESREMREYYPSVFGLEWRKDA
jgi:hypothetical protein